MRIKMPAVRIAQGDSDTGQPHQDILTCGVCQKPFALGDINKFIQHKVHACNKENYALEQNNLPDPSNNDDAGCGGVPLAVVNTRRPSISAPIKKGISCSAGASSGASRLVCSSPLQMDDEARCSTPKRPRTPNSSASPTPIKDEMDIDHHNHHHHHPHHHLDNCTDEYELKPRKIKQELDSTNSSPDLLKKSREVADAESNTSHSEPSYYICSTCKLRLHSAWRLVQHAQNVHGIKIYVDPSASSPSSSSSSSPLANPTSSSAAAAAASASKSANASSTNNHSSSSSCSASSALSGCSGTSSTGAGANCPTSVASSLAGSTLPLPVSAAATAAAISRLPLLPPGASVDAHGRFGIGGLLGMQLNEPPPGLRPHQFPSPLSLHGSASAPPPLSSMFSRPSSTSSSHHDNHFRMEQIVSEQFRLNPHHTLGLAAAAAAVAAASGIPPPHSPFTGADRPPSAGARSMIPPPPTLPLPNEPQLDYYSQRLRALAGTTSPGASSTANGGALPLRKQTPPAFTSPGNSQPLPSTRSSTSPRNLTSGASLSNNINHNNNNNVSMSNNNLSEGGSDVDLSMSPSSKMAAANDENDSLDLSSNVKTDPGGTSVDEKPADFSTGQSVHSDSEEKTRECEYCGKKFRFQSNLVVHRRTHTGEKPFKCSVCNHACTQSSKLKRHMKIHRKSNRGNGQTGGEGVEVAPVNGDGSTTSTPEDQMSNDGEEGGSTDVDEQERMDDDDEEAVDEEEEEEEEEDDEEEDEDEEEEDMELDDEGDEDDDGDVPEDLTTKSTSSTPSHTAATGADEMSSKSLHSPRPTPSQTPLGKSTTPLSDNCGKIGGSSLVGELMDTFGLSNIQQYSEAYKQAKQALMQEGAVHSPHIRKKDDPAALDVSAGITNNNNGISKLDGIPPHLQNGLKVKSLASLKMKEALAMAGQQPPLDIISASHGFFGSGMPFENLLDVANKRMKLDLDGRHNPLLGRNGLPTADDAMYPGLWFPAMASTHPRDFFGRGDIPLEIFKPSRASKSNLENRHDGTSAKSLAAAAAAAAMNLNLSGHQQQPHMKKESRRNDTCEYCGKVFKNCSNLTVHRRSHTGEKPYKCELCSYACAQSSKLTRHMKTHGRMGKDVYKCRFCEMPFSVPSTLEKHMRKCVVNQNMKNDNGHMVMPSMLLKCDDDSSISSAKDNT